MYLSITVTPNNSSAWNKHTRDSFNKKSNVTLLHVNFTVNSNTYSGLHKEKSCMFGNLATLQM